MPRRRTARPSHEGNHQPSPEEYSSFISQMELEAIWLRSAQVENRHGPETPENAIVQLESETQWEISSNGFYAFHSYNVAIQADNERVAEVRATFGLAFRSQQAMTDALFAIFKEVNLMLNTWPYLRAFLADAIGKMGWSMFTLPTYKVGTASPTRSSPHQRNSRKRRDT